MKKLLFSILFILLLINNIRAEYSDTITGTIYSDNDTITITKIISVDVIKQNDFVLDTSPSVVMNFSNYLPNIDSYSIYINGSLQFDSSIIDTDIITRQIEIIPNIKNIIGVYAFYENFISDSFMTNYYYITSSNYSMPDTIIINNIPKIIFDLTIENTENKRWKKLTELYPNLSGIKSEWQRWDIVFAGENDIYYKEPKLNYFKFKRLADKYK